MKCYLLPAILLGALLTPCAMSVASAEEQTSPFRTAILSDNGADSAIHPVQYGYGSRYGNRSYYGGQNYGYGNRGYGNRGYSRGYGYQGGYRPYYGNYNSYRPYYGNYNSYRPYYGNSGSFYYGGPGVSFGFGF